MRRFLVVFAILFGFFFGFAPAQAKVVAQVSLSKQVMVVKVYGRVAHIWRVSTARKGFITPHGSYKPQRMYVKYFSKKYYNAPMPYSIFFRGGYAVHGGYAKLGTPASHGCVRLTTAHAAELYNLAKQQGPRQTRIVITG